MGASERGRFSLYRGDLVLRRFWKVGSVEKSNFTKVRGLGNYFMEIF